MDGNSKKLIDSSGFKLAIVPEKQDKDNKINGVTLLPIDYVRKEIDDRIAKVFHISERLGFKKESVEYERFVYAIWLDLCANFDEMLNKIKTYHDIKWNKYYKYAKEG